MELQELKQSVDSIITAFGEFKVTHAKSLKDGDVLLEQKMQQMGLEIAGKLEAVNKHNEEAAKKMADINKQNDELEAKLGRVVNTPATASAEAELEAAREFKHSVLMIQKRNNAGEEIVPDLDEYREYKKAFPIYLRRDMPRLTSDNLKYMSVGSDPDGGYTVTPAVSAKVIKLIYETSPMRQVANVEKISTDSLEMATDMGEAEAGWVGETQARPETATPVMGKRAIYVHEVYAMPMATQKLLEDSAIDIEDWLGKKVAQKFARMENAAFFTGNGVGKPRGILTYAAGTDPTLSQIEQVNSGGASTFTADGFIDAVSAMKEPFLPGASWMMRRGSLGAVMKLKANSEYIFNTIFEKGFFGSLLGFPVRFAADMAAVGANELAAIFANFNEGYTIVDRLGITTLRDPYTTKGFVKFYTRKRVGGDVTNFEAIKIVKVAA